MKEKDDRGVLEKEVEGIEEKEQMLPMVVTGRERPKSEMVVFSKPVVACLGDQGQAEASPVARTAKDDTVPTNEGEQATTTTEANVALALAQLTQSSQQAEEEEQKTDLPLPTQTQPLAPTPASKSTPTAADTDQADAKTKAKTKGVKRWSRILPWK